MARLRLNLKKLTDPTTKLGSDLIVFVMVAEIVELQDLRRHQEKC